MWQGASKCLGLYHIHQGQSDDVLAAQVRFHSSLVHCSGKRVNVLKLGIVEVLHFCKKQKARRQAKNPIRPPQKCCMCAAWLQTFCVMCDVVYVVSSLQDGYESRLVQNWSARKAEAGPCLQAVHMGALHVLFASLAFMAAGRESHRPCLPRARHQQTAPLEAFSALWHYNEVPFMPLYLLCLPSLLLGMYLL